MCPNYAWFLQTKRAPQKHVTLFYFTYLFSWSLCFFPPRNFTVKLVWFLVFPCLLLVYTVVPDWNRILELFLFLSRKLEQADTEPADFLSPTIPQAVCRLCKHTFPPLLSSSRLPADGPAAVGLLRVGTHGDTQTPHSPWTDIIISSSAQPTAAPSGAPRYFQLFLFAVQKKKKSHAVFRSYPVPCCVAATERWFD